MQRHQQGLTIVSPSNFRSEKNKRKDQEEREQKEERINNKQANLKTLTISQPTKHLHLKTVPMHSGPLSQFAYNEISLVTPVKNVFSCRQNGFRCGKRLPV